MGIDPTILNTVVQAFAWGLAAALAIGVGIALGWSGKDYVATNIERWMGQTADSQATLGPDDAGDASAVPSDD